MTHAWLLVAIVGVATVLLKGAGPLALGERPLPAVAAQVVALLAPALLAALIVVQTFSDGQRLVLDARAAGLAVAAVALLARAPTLVVVFLAAVTAATVRFLVGG